MEDLELAIRHISLLCQRSNIKAPLAVTITMPDEREKVRLDAVITHALVRDMLKWVDTDKPPTSYKNLKIMGIKVEVVA